MIETPRLYLIPATVQDLAADLLGPAELAAALQYNVAETWPPELYDAAAVEWTLKRLESMPSEAEWWMHYIVVTATSEVVGACGFKGQVSPDGTVEVGYSVLSEHQRRGYAFEAVTGLVSRAFQVPAVRSVIAETLPELTPSIGVLEKSGFAFIGEGSEPGVIRYELLRTVPVEEVPVANGR